MTYPRRLPDHRRADLTRKGALACPVQVLRAMATLLLRADSAAACSAVNGGATTIATPSKSLTRPRAL